MSYTPPNNDRLLQTIRAEITFSGHFQTEDAVLTPDLSRSVFEKWEPT